MKDCLIELSDRLNDSIIQSVNGSIPAGFLPGRQGSKGLLFGLRRISGTNESRQYVFQGPGHPGRGVQPANDLDYALGTKGVYGLSCFRHVSSGGCSPPGKGESKERARVN